MMSPVDHGDVLHARPAVVLQVLVDLRLPLALGRLVDRELDPPGAVLHHLRHQGRVLGADVLVVERDELLEAEHLAVELDPLVHLPFFDVADDVVDGRQADRVGRRRAVAFRVERLEARGEHAAIAVAVDEGVRRVAVGLDGRRLEDAELVFQCLAACGPASPRERRPLRTRLARPARRGRCPSRRRRGVMSRWLSGCSLLSGEMRTNVISPCRRTYPASCRTLVSSPA